MKNERIQELVEQATVATDQELHRLSQGIEGMPSRLDLFNQKFAELIVRNCIVDFYRNYLDTTSDEDITKQVDRYVKQQFGVE